MIDSPNVLTSMVNTRGRVVWVKYWEVALEKERGSKIIHNPRETYYPQYDQELNRINNSAEITDNYEEKEVLEVIEI